MQCKRTTLIVGVTISTMAMMTGCSSFSPDAGHEIVLVQKPMIFGHGGVDPDPVKTGRTYAALTTDGIDVYVQPYNTRRNFPTR